MDLTPYLDNLRRDLGASAAAGGPGVAEAAERLAQALEPALRLALMEALAEAAAQITSDMPAGGVEVRLRGRDPEFVVHQLPVPAPERPAPLAGEDSEEPDGNLARISLRLPEQLKAKAEERAAAAGQSLNSWLVAAVRSATRDAAINVDIDLSSIPFLGSDPFGGRGKGGRRMTGWI